MEKERNSFLYKEESYKILGACFEVYKEIGPGFLEAVYQECLEYEFRIQGISFEAQKHLCIRYKDYELKQQYIPDFVCYDSIIIELKAVSAITDQHQAQVINYLKATKHESGFIMNFSGFPKLDYKRIALNNV